MDINVKVNYGKLKELVQNMSKQYTVKVGLLADKEGQKGVKGSDDVPNTSDIDYAGLGAVQEFGCDIKITQKMAAFLAITAKELGLPKLNTQSDGYIHIPARSFLQMPLTKKNAVISELKKQLDTKDLEDIISYFGKTGDLMTLAVMLGASAVEVVMQAFDTSGWGQWKPDSPFTIAMKGSANPLQDKGNLQGAITFEVEENG